MGGNGAGERNRTSDLRITNALLYQLSYTGTPFAFLLSKNSRSLREMRIVSDRLEKASVLRKKFSRTPLPPCQDRKNFSAAATSDALSGVCESISVMSFMERIHVIWRFASCRVAALALSTNAA